jgi:DNA polymerase-1
MGIGDAFRAGVWAVDFEFHAPPGERPRPICMVAMELKSNRTIMLNETQLRARPEAPFPTGPDALFTAFYASAEFGCFLSLGWKLPERILDLYVEHCNSVSGLGTPFGNSLLGALEYRGLSGIAAGEKTAMRELAIRGGPFTAEEIASLLEYCHSDVVAVGELLVAMEDEIDLPRALLRGRYMAAVAMMEYVGVPIDVGTLHDLRSYWSQIRASLIQRIDADFGVYDGQTFKQDRFRRFLVEKGIPWPELESGNLDLSKDTFREMSRVHSIVAPLAELRHAMSDLRLESLAVGADGRNRCLLSPFKSKTGRNQPSTNRFIYGPSVWMRSLIKPDEGRAVAYLDFEQQEFGIAAALSGDAAMQAAYLSGDPYLAFAKQAGAVPNDATKSSHAVEREQFKQCILGVQYGMGPQSLAQRLGQPEFVARQLLLNHQETYRRFWTWSRSAVDEAMLLGRLRSVFGWHVHVGRDVNPRSLANFPMQANGAEMLRLACCLATERGIAVCAPVHDAVLIEAAADEIYDAVAGMRSAMIEASRIVLNGFTIRAKPEAVITFPERYMDEKRGGKMWQTVLAALEDARRQAY